MSEKTVQDSKPLKQMKAYFVLLCPVITVDGIEYAYVKSRFR
jgi:hypothetical protein